MSPQGGWHRRVVSPKVLQHTLLSELSAPVVQTSSDGGAEYIIDVFGSYQRMNRDPDEMEPVLPSERTMLDICVSTFAHLASTCTSKVAEPPPPRFRSVTPLAHPR